MAAKGARVHIYGDWDGAGVKRAQQDIGAFQKQATGFSGAMTKSFLGVGAAMGGAFAIGNLVGSAVDFLKDASAAAMEDEKSVVALSKAMDNLGLAHKNSGVEEFISQMQLATGVADSDLRKAYQTLVTATGDATEAQDLLGTSMDASAATGRSLESITLAVAKASQGQVSALKRLGIPLDENTIKTKDFAAAVDTMNTKFGGQAAAAAQTYAGKLARVQEAANEAQETIGYALLNAVDNVADAFGGADGMTSGITSAGDVLAGLVTGLGEAAAVIADVAAEAAKAAGAVGEDGGGFAEGLQLAAVGALNFVPVVGPVASALISVTKSGMEANEEMAKSRQVTDALSAGYQMLLEKINPAAAAQRDAASAAESAKESLDALKAAQQRLDDQLSKVSARLEFGRWLRDLDEQLRGNARTFDGWGEDARENQDALIEGWQAAKSRTDEFFKGTTASAEEWREQFGKNARKVVQQFVDDGFKPKDIRAFLKEAGLWQAEFANLIGLLTKGQAAAAARQSGMAAGENVWKAYVAALNAGRDAAYRAGYALGAASNAGAQDALDIASPSRVFYANGVMVVNGFVTGILSGTDRAANAAAIIANAAAASSQQVVRENIQAYLGIMQQAYGAIDSIAQSITSQVMGGINFSSENPDGTPMTPEQMVQMMFGDINAQRQMVSTVASQIGDSLPPALLSQILAMPPESAIALANYLGDNPQMLEALGTHYANLGTITETILGVPMGEAWAKVGGESAAAMIAAAQEYLTEHGKAFKRWVRENLSTTIDVTVNYVTGSAPRFGGGKASGGPVSAGTTYLVGEKGPELLTMGSSGGFVTPNGGTAKAVGGNTYQINLNATPATDKRRLGQEMVEAIRAFEKSNGSVWAAA